MDLHEIAEHRLFTQQLIRSKLRQPEQLIAAMGAIQGQDYPGAKWSLGLRLPDLTEAKVEKALQQKKIVRSWIMRGTLHFAAAEDLDWLLALLGPRIIAGSKRRYRELELDDKTLSRSSELLVKALEASPQLNRKELLALLRQNKISTEGQRGVFMLQRASLDGSICQTTMTANVANFCLTESLPKVKLGREEALAELVRRYFRTRGPATLQDFLWWSGLTGAEAKPALEEIQSELESETLDAKTYYWSTRMLPKRKTASEAACLLPGFDEYLLAYKDRTASLGVKNYDRPTPANGLLPGTILIDGQVLGTWKRTFARGGVVISLKPFHPLSRESLPGVEAAAKDFGRFLGMPAKINQTIPE